MKTILKVFIPIALIGGIIFYVFRSVEPIDDTKKLYVYCNDSSENYDIYSGTKVTFASKNPNCELNITVENVDRTYLKLKSNVFLFKLDGNNKIDENTISKDIFVIPSEKLTLYSQNKKTKFEFEYK